MERLPLIYDRFKKNALAQTVAKTAAFYATEAISIPILVGKMRLPIGTGDTEEDHEWDMKNLHLLIPSATVAAPIIEETVFRFIPSLMTDKEKPSWKIGIAASLAFALVHNLKTNDLRKITLETKKIPLYQFVTGIFLWHIAKRHGIRNSIISHSLINSAFVTLTLLENIIKMKPPKGNQNN